MLGDLLQGALVISLLAATVRMATPILLAALGELVTERGGVMNLGVEGTMLMGAFIGFLVANQTGSLALAVGAAMLAGAGMSLIMAVMASTLKVDQTVTGLALNLLASGLSFYWYRVAYKGEGASQVPVAEIFQVLPIPLLSRLPVIGEFLFSQYLLTYIALLMVPAVWFFLYRTKYGLLVRCLGENPRSVDMKGVSVARLQYLALAFGGMMAGMGGSFLTLASAGVFVPEISAGRGWLAIVIVIAGNWQPGRILLATLVFAFLDAFQLQVQGLGVKLPYQILLALPYVFAILAMVLSRTRSQAPGSLGVPYVRE
ncbi:MAG TPA: ABC transporter permease [Anaerolineales bacterium]|nr:ABC transporter permease [Anaerolineales bacterium]